MKWFGSKEIVVREVDENNNVVVEYRIKPGEELPIEILNIMNNNEIIEYKIGHKVVEMEVLKYESEQ